MRGVRPIREDEYRGTFRAMPRADSFYDVHTRSHAAEKVGYQHVRIEIVDAVDTFVSGLRFANDLAILHPLKRLTNAVSRELRIFDNVDALHFASGPRTGGVPARRQSASLMRGKNAADGRRTSRPARHHGGRVSAGGWSRSAGSGNVGPCPEFP